MSQRYEVLFVLRPDLGEAGVSDQIEKARRVLTEQGVSSVQVQDWGMKDLAYRIETHRRGHYFLLEYEGTAAAVAELERNLKLSDQVLRFMSIRQSDGGEEGRRRAQPPPVEAPAQARPPEAGEPEGVRPEMRAVDTKENEEGKPRPPEASEGEG